jgi:hypothetical protein
MGAEFASNPFGPIGGAGIDNNYFIHETTGAFKAAPDMVFLVTDNHA